MIISVVGSRASGKSHYIGVIIHELKERIAGKFGGTFTDFDDNTKEYYGDMFGRSLYNERTKLSLTGGLGSGFGKSSVSRPLIYKFNIQKDLLFFKIRKSYTLVFFDNAGEDLENLESMLTVNRNIAKSAGLIFLLDPMQLASVRTSLKDNEVSGAVQIDEKEISSPLDVLNRVSTLIRKDKKIKESKKISVPIAAVLSKLDAVKPLIAEGNPLVLEESPHWKAGAFVLEDDHNVNTEVESLLRKWDAAAFINYLTMNYANYSYFGVSSLGRSPDDVSITTPQPHRIEDPLLWIFKESGVIKSIKAEK
jgi:hypothetical protein